MYKITETELKKIKKVLEELSDHVRAEDPFAIYGTATIDQASKIIKSLEENYNIK